MRGGGDGCGGGWARSGLERLLIARDKNLDWVLCVRYICKSGLCTNPNLDVYSPKTRTYKVQSRTGRLPVGVCVQVEYEQIESDRELS